MYSLSVDTEQPRMDSPDGEELTLQAAATYAECSVKTLRRAIHAGKLQHTYAIGQHGPQYLITRAELDRWRGAQSGGSPESGQGEGAATAAGEGTVDTHLSTWTQPSAVSSVSTLQAAIDQVVRSAVVPLVDELHTTRTELGNAREQLGAARERVAHLEAQLATRQPAPHRPLWLRLVRRLLAG
jgi:excisionase family DNA binding protein